jgi:hypothetical protein
MNVRDYLIAALKAGAAAKRDWLISILAITDLPEAPVAHYPYELYQSNGKFCFNDPEAEGLPTVLVDSKIGQSLTHMKQVIAIEANEVLTVTKPIVTLVGNLIFNYMVVLGPFGGKIPFQLGKVDLRKLEKQIAALLDDEPVDGQRKPDRIYWDELQRYNKYGLALGGLEVFCVPAASKRGLLPHPEAKALRQKLIQERQGRLHDPAVVAEITAALEKLDREWIAGDPDRGFFTTNKSFQVTRMRTYGVWGIEEDLANGGFKLIESTLVEGWKPEDLPITATAARDGSFSRGALTALGGDKVKTMLRTMSGVNITSEDCGSTLGLSDEISLASIGHGVVVGQKTVQLTEENIKDYVGKVLPRRSPMFCKESPNNFCMTCFGEFIRARRDAVSLVVSEVGSLFMLTKMKRMHGSALKTKRYKYMEDIS